MDYTSKSSDQIGSAVYTWDALTAPMGRKGRRNRLGHAVRRAAGTITGAPVAPRSEPAWQPVRPSQRRLWDASAALAYCNRMAYEQVISENLSKHLRKTSPKYRKISLPPPPPPPPPPSVQAHSLLSTALSSPHAR
eukprot:SAG31_NODE_1253_length_9089_cov_17.716765_4_plen_136_part_00